MQAAPDDSYGCRVTVTSYIGFMPGTLHLIHGYMGVGKTTLARRLERELPGIRFSQDEWMVALYGVDPPESEYRAAQDRVRGVMEGCWRRCLELGEHVILDSGLWRRAERDHLRGVAQEVGAAVRLYALTLLDEEALTRVLARNEHEPGHLYVSENTYHVLKAHFEPLGEDEWAEVVS